MSFTKVSPGVYRVSNIDVAVVNSLRRIILAEIPNLAFDVADIRVLKNTGCLNNEFLSHRLSLVPICFDPEKDMPDILGYRFVMNLKNDTDEIMNVTSQHIQVFDGDTPVDQSIRDRLFPKNPMTGDSILITKLMPNPYSTAFCQEIELEMKATLNIAKTHARWCPVSKCSYMNVIDEEAAAEARKTAENKKLFDVHGKYRYYKKNEFEMYIKSECAMTEDYLLKKAVDILMGHCERYLEKSEIKETVNSMFEMTIPDEDFTLVNLLQSFIYNQEIGKALDYIGYYQPHPLEKKMVLKMRFAEAMSVQEVKDFMALQNTRICNMLTGLGI